MEEFRFHMTLTGRLNAERREPILSMLRHHFSTLGIETLAIDRLALFRQERPIRDLGSSITGDCAKGIQPT